MCFSQTIALKNFRDSQQGREQNSLGNGVYSPLTDLLTLIAQSTDNIRRFASWTVMAWPLPLG